MSAIPYLDSYWVLPDRFLAGAYPGDYEEEKARRKVQSLIHAGITTIIDLTYPGDSFYPYMSLLKQEADDFGVKVERLNFPIEDYDIPTQQLMTGILNAIDQRLQTGQKVYVHCIGGIGRTGTTVGCYLVRHGLSGEEALLELENLRQQAASWFRRSPESDLQIEFVRRWKPGQ
jgi:hypothetical protein